MILLADFEGEQKHSPEAKAFGSAQDANEAEDFLQKHP
jgi:hypothetical protein